MDALHALGEQGGWPLTMFLTPELKPFWGGTYFPPISKFGRPSFSHVLKEISRIWNSERDKASFNSEAILSALQAAPPATQVNQPLTSQLILKAALRISEAIDLEYGGLSGAPKFPQSPLFGFLWAVHQDTKDESLKTATSITLEHICRGGIYDHLAGGIARYSVDHKWLVPHFEKMLYDNAQLITLLSDVVLTYGNELFRSRIKQSSDWILAALRRKDSLFASSYDADSEGVEGKYYCWSKAEIDDILSESTRHQFCELYDVSEEGNWEGLNILHETQPIEALPGAIQRDLKVARSELLQARQDRVPPELDDKALTDWNALTVSALLRAAVAAENAEYAKAALETLLAVFENLMQGGRLYHSHRASQLRGLATADDHAHLIKASIDAYEHTLDKNWVTKSVEIAKRLEHDYRQANVDGYQMASNHAEDVIFKDAYYADDVTPNANSVMVVNLFKLSVLTGDPTYIDRAQELQDWLAPRMLQNPFATPSAWRSALQLNSQTQILLSGDKEQNSFKALYKICLARPDTSSTLAHIEDISTLPETHPAHLSIDRKKIAAYICENQTCSLPISEAPELRKRLGVH